MLIYTHECNMLGQHMSKYKVYMGFIRYGHAIVELVTKKVL